MEAESWCNKAIEMKVCKLLMGLEKIKFGANVVKQLVHG